MDKTDDFQLGQMYKMEPEEPEVKEDIDHWLDEEDIGNNFMLRQQYMNQNRQDELDHGFGGKDDDGFRGSIVPMDSMDHIHQVLILMILIWKGKKTACKENTPDRLLYFGLI